MFDAISVSERTRRPWTVVVSFAGQCVMIGLAILAPLVGTEALPHGRLVSFLLPEPPAAPPRPAAQNTERVVKPIARQIEQGILREPTRIPAHAAVIEEMPDYAPEGGDSVGVVGGTGPLGARNGIIDGIARAAAVVPVTPPPPPVVAAAPKAIPRIVVGGQVQAGKLLSGPRPVYPTLARQARISGMVRLEAVIARDGTIVNLRAVSGHPLLIPAAVSAVKQWVFRPTYLNGEPVEVATQIDVNFTLQP